MDAEGTAQVYLANLREDLCPTVDFSAMIRSKYYTTTAILTALQLALISFKYVVEKITRILVLLAYNNSRRLYANV